MMNETQIRERIKRLSGILDACQKSDTQRKKGAQTPVYRTDYMSGEIASLQYVLRH